MPFKSIFPDQLVIDSSLHDFVFQKFERNRDRLAIIDEGSGKSFTFAEIRLYSERVKAGLYAEGLRKGDTVVLASPNCAEWAIILFGVLPLGGIVSGVNPSYTEEEFRYHLEDSGASFLITDKTCYSRLKKAMKALKNPLKAVFVIDGEHELKDVKNFDQLMEYPASKLNIPPVKIHTKSDVALLPYSSGTTGVPKGVMITHQNVVCDLTIASGSFFIMPTEGENFYVIMPFFHIYGLILLLMCLKEGATTIVTPKFESRQFLRILDEYKIRMMPLVPPLLLFLAKEPIVTEYDLSRLEAVLVGAAPVGKELSEEFLKRFPHVKFLIQGYGLTETCAASCMIPPFENYKLGSAGLLLPNLECRILDIATGKDLGPNEDGEICIRGETIMKGYHNRPEATAEMIDKDGFLHTGDIGHVDEDGYFFITDRLKELIKVKGFQVAPAELEAIILSHPSVRDVGVIGVPDLEHGELPRAYVVLHANKTLTSAELDAFLAGHVATFKRLKGGVDFVDEIPKSPSGKILRRLLKQRFLEEQKTKSKL